MSKRNNLTLSGLLVLLIGSTALLVYATGYGIGISPDSVAYLLGARGINDTGSLASLSSHWPPLYPLIVAALGTLTDNVFTAAHWLHVVLLIANILLLFYLLRRRNPVATVAIIAGTIVIVLSPEVFATHTMAWTEPQFILFSLGGIALLSRAVTSGERRTYLFAGLLIGFAFLSRYVGVTLIAAGTLFILLQRRSLKQRAIDALVFDFAACLPMLPWAIRNLLVANNATNRHFAFHPPSLAELMDGVNNLGEFFVLPHAIAIFTPLLVIFVATIYWRQRPRHDLTPENDRALIDLLFLNAFVYLGFLLVSITFFDAHTPLDGRILTPFFVYFASATILHLIAVAARPETAARRRVAIAGGLSVFALLSVARTIPLANTYANHGIGFAAKAWIYSDTLAAVKMLPTDYRLFSNVPEPIELYTERAVEMIPRVVDPISRQLNPEFETQFSKIIGLINEGKAELVYFDGGTWRWYLPQRAPLDATFNDAVLYRGRDGVIYGKRK